MHILLIGGRDERFKSFHDVGHDFSIIQLKSHIGLEQHLLSDNIVLLDVFNEQNVFGVAENIHAEKPIDYVFAFIEEALLPAAFAANELKLKGMDFSSCKICIDKSSMRSILEGTRFELTSRKCSSSIDAIAFFRKCNGPIVLKDASGCGSMNVYICRSESEVQNAWVELEGNHYISVLAEKYVEGDEYSLETLSIRGQHELIGVTKKYLLPGTLIEHHHIYPAPDLSAEQLLALSDFSVELLDQIKYPHGPCHIEVKINNGSVNLIEINNRNGGDYIWQMVQMVSGVDLIKESIQFAVEGSPNTELRRNNKRYSKMISRAFFGPVDTKEIKMHIPENLELVTLNTSDSCKRGKDIMCSGDRRGFLVAGGVSDTNFFSSVQELDEYISTQENA